MAGKLSDADRAKARLVHDHDQSCAATAAKFRRLAQRDEDPIVQLSHERIAERFEQEVWRTDDL